MQRYSEKIILKDEFEIFVPFNKDEQKCFICDELVLSPSMGGNLICSWCDVGVNRNGKKWDFKETMLKTGINSKASKRKAEILDLQKNKVF